MSSYISKDFLKNLIVVDNISEKDFKFVHSYNGF